MAGPCRAPRSAVAQRVAARRGPNASRYRRVYAGRAQRDVYDVAIDSYSARDCDLLPGDRDGRRARDGLRLAIERRVRSGQRLPQDVPLRAGGRARLRHPDERQPVDQPVDHLAAARATSTPARGWRRRRRSITPPGSSATACGRSRRSIAPRSSATISASTSTCCSAARSAARPPALYLIYPQGNPLQATEDSPYLQLGEVQVRPADPRSRHRHGGTSLEVAAKYALLSFDATMRSNVTVGPPIDLLLYKKDSFDVDALPAARGARSGPQPDSRLVGAVAAAGRRAAAGDRLRASRIAAQHARRAPWRSDATPAPDRLDGCMMRLTHRRSVP